MVRLDKTRRIELGRRYALKEITLDEAVKAYGVHKSTVWAAAKDYLRDQPQPDLHDERQQGLGDAEKARPEKGPTRPPVDHSYVDELQKENQALHDEVRTLQKIVMTLGRVL